jgi:hypothetical protein
MEPWVSSTALISVRPRPLPDNVRALIHWFPFNIYRPGLAGRVLTLQVVGSRHRGKRVELFGNWAFDYSLHLGPARAPL